MNRVESFKHVIQLLKEMHDEELEKIGAKPGSVAAKIIEQNINSHMKLTIIENAQRYMEILFNSISDDLLE